MTDPTLDLTSTRLFDRIHAALLAGAIGDAMGGPVEGLSYQEIEARHGVVDTLLPYPFRPDYHNQFASAPGSVTDDTRLRHLVAEALVADDSPCWHGGLPRRGDLVWTLVSAYHAAETPLARGFLEEYALGGVYDEAKLIWGGQMTNGFLMANAPLGLICPGDPQAAFNLSFDLDFISDGYAKYAAAMGAAAVAAALAQPAADEGCGEEGDPPLYHSPSPEPVVRAALAAAKAHRVEGPQTRAWQWYDHVFTLNERLIDTAVTLALKHRDVLALREPYYQALHVSDLGSEAAQTLAVALGMLVAAEGDLRQTIVGCVNYGRDNDSYATLAGAIAGALHGTAAIPTEWRQTVVNANPTLDFAALSRRLTQVAYRRHLRHQRTVNAVAPLLKEIDKSQVTNSRRPE